jgi:hypothetical protein
MLQILAHVSRTDLVVLEYRLPTGLLALADGCTVEFISVAANLL